MNSIKRIQKYLDGEMSESEMIQFREDLKSNPELLNAFELHKTIDEVIISKEEIRFRKKLNEAYKTYKIIPEAEKNNKTGFGIKSGFLLVSLVLSISIISGGYLLYYRTDADSGVYEKYFNTYSQPFIENTRSANSMRDLKFENALNLYQQKKFSLASKEFQSILIDNPNHQDARFYKGLCFVYLNEMDNAINTFEYLLSQSEGYQHINAEWYLALCYIRVNNLESARSILKKISEENATYANEAKKLLKSLS